MSIDGIPYALNVKVNKGWTSSQCETNNIFVWWMNGTSGIILPKANWVLLTKNLKLTWCVKAVLSWFGRLASRRAQVLARIWLSTFIIQIGCKWFSPTTDPQKTIVYLLNLLPTKPQICMPCPWGLSMQICKLQSETSIPANSDGSAFMYIISNTQTYNGSTGSCSHIDSLTKFNFKISCSVLHTAYCLAEYTSIRLDAKTLNFAHAATTGMTSSFSLWLSGETKQYWTDFATPLYISIAGCLVGCLGFTAVSCDEAVYEGRNRPMW